MRVKGATMLSKYDSSSIEPTKVVLKLHFVLKLCGAYKMMRLLLYLKVSARYTMSVLVRASQEEQKTGSHEMKYSIYVKNGRNLLKSTFRNIRNM